MTSYRRVIPPTLPTGAAAAGSQAGSLFAALRLARLRAREQLRQKAELDDWEAEGGSVAASLAVAREPPVLARSVGRGPVDAATR